MDKDKLIELLMSEYVYWRDQEFDDGNATLIQIGAMGAVSNLLAAVMSFKADWHPKVDE